MLTLRQTHGYLGYANNRVAWTTSLGYIINNLVKSSLLSSLMLTNIRFLFFDPL